MILTAAAWNEMVSHARAQAPLECCGVLMGDESGRITRALRAENEERDAPGTSYRLGREAHLKAVRMEAAGEAFIAAYYHSHPSGPPRPSREDARRAVPQVIYVIVSLAGSVPAAGAWRWSGERFLCVPLQVEPPAEAAEPGTLLCPPRGRSRTGDNGAEPGGIPRIR